MSYLEKREYSLEEKTEREKVKKKIKEYIEMNGTPDVAYFYDGGELTFEYTDEESGLGILSNETFNYWGEKGLYGKRVFQEDYEALLEEIGILCPVCSLQDRDESEGIDSIEDFLFEYCIGNKELTDKFYKMTAAEKVAWYEKIMKEYE